MQVGINPDRDFDFWLKQYNNFLPSPQTRWCTRRLKLRPFEAWLRPRLESGARVTSYVAIRADEEFREGYSSKHKNLAVRLPFKEFGIDKAGGVHALTADTAKVTAARCDLFSLSSHKIYGPKGIGCLFARSGVQHLIEPLIYGGGQQAGLRSGTVPVPLCVGFAEALLRRYV